MLRAHANAPDPALTAQELANAVGYDNYKPVNAQYGRLGRQIAAELPNLRPLQYEKLNKPFWTSILAEAEHDERGHWRWTMHLELVEALHKLNMA